jgi:hypothetical protein
VVQVGSAAAPVGSTVTSYRTGGTKGTNCPATGGCTMAQAFPLPGDVFDSAGRVITKGGLRTLTESRPTPGGNITSGAFEGLPNNCAQDRSDTGHAGRHPESDHQHVLHHPDRHQYQHAADAVRPQSRWR